MATTRDDVTTDSGVAADGGGAVNGGVSAIGGPARKGGASSRAATDAEEMTDHEVTAIASMVERHEAEVWARCIEIAATQPGNPLGAVIDRSGPVPIPALTAVDAGSFNRVVGLGIETPATPELIDAIVQFYRGLGQRNFQVDLAPVAAPADTPTWLRQAGLHPATEQMTKVWGRLENLDVEPEDCEIRQLTEADAGRVAALNVRAWGAWQAPVSLAPWFGATVGREGFAHYGGFVDDRLLCTGAMVVDGPLAWIGFDATHPRHQSRQLRRALTARRILDARAAGCAIIHAEGRTDRLSGRSRVLETLYVRNIYTPAVQSAAEPAGSP